MLGMTAMSPVYFLFLVADVIAYLLLVTPAKAFYIKKESGSDLRKEEPEYEKKYWLCESGFLHCSVAYGHLPPGELKTESKIC